MSTEIMTGVGRIVWGNPAKSQIKKDINTKQPVLRDGEQVHQWAFGVAFPKGEFQQLIWPGMAKEAATGYPQGVPPNFAWKYQDGDGVDSSGKPFNTREGYAGCYILTVSSQAFAPPIYKFTNGVYVQLDDKGIKTGDFVVLSLKLDVNVPQVRTHTPGLYVNPKAIEHVGYGQEIQNGPDPMALFGGQQRQLPPGASATPLAPTHNVVMPGTAPMQPQQPGSYQQPMPGQYQPPAGGPISSGLPGQQPPMQPQPGYQPQQPPMQPQPGYQPQQPPMQPQPGYQQPGGYPPAHDFVHNAGQQQPGGYPPQQPIPGQYQQPIPGQYQQPMPGQYQQPMPGAQQPGQMPGMLPNR